jgi:23S rRNA (guanosine2251-2'-O)-methyltransferase
MKNQAKPASQGGGRAQRPGLLLWGTHPVLAALANPERQLHRLLATPEAAKSHAAELERLGRQRRLPALESVSRAELDQWLPPAAVHQGIALAADPLPDLGIEDLAYAAKDRDSAVIMVLDQVTDPHNVGAILRSAAAFGAIGVVTQDRNAPEETGTLAKSASGALEKLPLVKVANLARAIDTLKQAGFWIAGLAGDAAKTLAEARLSGKIALVVGSEGEGLRRLTREHCDYLVKLPQTELVESLNVSNAAAVALYELMRR